MRNGGGGSDTCEGYEGNQAGQEDERNPEEDELSKQKHKEGFHQDSSVVPSDLSPPSLLNCC